MTYSNKHNPITGTAAQAVPSTAKIVPEKLFSAPNVTVLARKGNAAILHKHLSHGMQTTPIFTKTPCLNIVVQGLKRIHTHDDDYFEVSKDEVVFMPQDIYSIADIGITESNAFETYLFFFDESVIHEYLDSRRISLADGDPLEVFTCKYGKSLRLFANSLIPLFQSLDEKANDLVKVKLLEALYLLEAADKEKKFTNWLFRSTKGRERDLKVFMEQHADKGLTVKDYAALTGRSESVFRREFKQSYGIPPSEWLLKKKLSRAEKLLSEGTSVADTAYAIGYENTSHFIRAFRKLYTVSPKEFQSLQGLQVLS
ncbi:MAG: AraC family transcriptional regulator [Spirochaetota bacterium]